MPLSTLDNPLLIAFLLVGCVGIPVLGNFRPDLVSFLPVDALLRRQLGDEPVAVPQGQRRRGEARHARSTSRRRSSVEQLTQLYDRETGRAAARQRASRSARCTRHGRALNGLLPRAVDDVEDYTCARASSIAGVVLGWNFGDGHFHNEQLLEAVQERCDFEPGELRVITLESQPAHVQRQHYRIYDAATGLIEEGWVERRRHGRARSRGSTSREFPVEVAGGARPGRADAAA